MVFKRVCSILKSNLRYNEKVRCIETLLARANRIEQANQDEVLRSFDCFITLVFQFPIPTAIPGKTANNVIASYLNPEAPGKISLDVLVHRTSLIQVANFVKTKGLNLAYAGEFIRLFHLAYAKYSRESDEFTPGLKSLGVNTHDEIMRLMISKLVEVQSPEQFQGQAERFHTEAMAILLKDLPKGEAEIDFTLIVRANVS
jgi:hypothetical protein